MAHAKNHDYHILPPSIEPLLGAVAAFFMLFGAVLWMHDSGPWMFLIGFVAVLYVMFTWWSRVVEESHVGDHTTVVQIGLRYGVILFITSEVMFFAAWFWSFFKHAIYPMEDYFGSEYVAPEIYPVDALHLPLINTLILVAIWLCRYLGSPRTGSRKQPQRFDYGPDPINHLGRRVYRTSSIRICAPSPRRLGFRWRRVLL